MSSNVKISQIRSEYAYDQLRATFREVGISLATSFEAVPGYEDVWLRLKPAVAERFMQESSEGTLDKADIGWVERTSGSGSGYSLTVFAERFLRAMEDCISEHGRRPLLLRAPHGWNIKIHL